MNRLCNLVFCGFLFALVLVPLIAFNARAFDPDGALFSQASELEKIQIESYLSDSNDKSKPSVFYELVLSSIDRGIIINTDYIGDISSVRALSKKGKLGSKLGVGMENPSRGWTKIDFTYQKFDIEGIIVTGRYGTLKIDEVSNTNKIASALTSVKPIVIASGVLENSFFSPELSLTNPDNYKISVLDFVNDSFIDGQIFAITTDSIAVSFSNLQKEVVNDKGEIRISLKDPSGSYINTDFKAWGYKVSVSQTDINEPTNIKADIYGLPDNTKVKITFHPLPGQEIKPDTEVLSVNEINSSKSIATIKTKIPGPQPLNIVIERVIY
ncbi:MAG: hypothetical protein V3U54_05910 [Thermodesulfobacteriota bacterium]